MEIEKKYLIDPAQIPYSLDSLSFHQIEQGYLSTHPVVRVRKSDEDYYLTYKGSGFIAREEYNLPLTKESYEHLVAKSDGNIITKTRYLIPEKNELTIELDVFAGCFAGLILAEVEFPDLESAQQYTPPAWFGREVSEEGTYQNSHLSRMENPQLLFV